MGREPQRPAGSQGRAPAQNAPAGRALEADGEGASAASARSEPEGRWQPDVLAWAPAAHLIGANGNSIVVVDADRNQVVTRQEVAIAGPTAIAASPDGRRVVVADMSKKGYLFWDTRARVISRLNGHGDRVVSVAMSSDGTRAASVSWNGTALLWDMVSRKQLAKVKISSGSGGAELSAVAFAHSDSSIALGTLDGNVCIWNPDDGKWKVVARHDDEPEIKPSKILPAVKEIAFTTDGEFVVSGGQDQYVLLTDPRGNLEGSSAGPYKYIGVQSLAVSAASDLLAIGHADGIDVVSYRVPKSKASGGIELSMKAHIDIRGGAQSLAFSPDGQRLAASVIGEGVTVWEVASGESYPLDPR